MALPTRYCKYGTMFQHKQSMDLFTTFCCRAEQIGGQYIYKRIKMSNMLPNYSIHRYEYRKQEAQNFFFHRKVCPISIQIACQLATITLAVVQLCHHLAYLKDQEASPTYLTRLILFSALQCHTQIQQGGFMCFGTNIWA